MVRRGLAAGVLGLVALAAAAAPAGAAIETAVPAAGPVLAGEHVLWATTRDDGGFDVRSATGPSDARVVQSLRRADVADPHHFLRPQLAASAERVALTVNPGEATRRWSARLTFSGPPEGPFTRVPGGCRLPGSYPDLPRPSDAAGDSIAHVPCDDGGLEVRDFSPAPVAQRIPTGPYATAARIAGRFVAWIEGGDGVWDLDVRDGDVVVYDRVALREAYRLPKAALGRGIQTLDLQDDGKVAFAYGAADGNAVGWASPEEPSVHRLPLPRGDVYEVRIAGGRIGLLRGEGVNFDVPLASVEVADLAGSVRTVARGAQDYVGLESFDFDGRRAAWYSRGCTGARIETRAVDDPPLTFRPRSGCPLRLDPKPTRRPRLVKFRYVRLFADCTGFVEDRCEVRDVVLSRGGVVLARGATSERVYLTTAGRRAFRGRSKLRVRGSALLTDDAGRRERRSSTFTVAR